MLKRIGFQTKLTLGFSLISLVSTVLFGAVSYRIASETAYDLMNRDLDDQIKAVRAAIDVSMQSNIERQNKLMDYWFKQIENKLEINATQSVEQEIVNQVTRDKIRIPVPSLSVGHRLAVDDTFVDEISAQSQDTVTVFAFLKEGLVRISTSVKDKEGKRAKYTFIPPDSPVYKAVSEGKRYSGRAQVVGEWFVTSYQPIFNGDKVIGAFFMGTPETSYYKIKSFLKEKRILKTGYFFILDSKGRFVLHPTKEGEDSLKMADLNGKEIFKEILEKKEGRIEYQWLNAETKQVQNKGASFTYFPDMDWYVAASYNMEEAYESVTHLKNLTWILGLVNLAVMIAATLALGIPMSRKLKSIGRELTKTAKNGLEGALQLQNASSNVAESSVEQAASLQQTVSALDEIRAMVERNLESTGSASKTSLEMTSKAEQGQDALGTLNQSIQSIARSNDDVRDEIERSFSDLENINRLIGEIKKRTEVINEIVFQTKLISLNASVEAARAGQHGRGFSVVAEEVGRLANMSGEAAQEIESNLSKTIQSVSDIIGKTKKNVGHLVQVSSSAIASGVQEAQQCQTILQEITAEIHQAKEMIGEIASASKEQSTGISEIASAMHQLDKATQQNSVSAQKVNSLADEVQLNSQSLNEASRSLREFLGIRESQEASVVHPARVSNDSQKKLKAA